MFLLSVLTIRKSIPLVKQIHRGRLTLLDREIGFVEFCNGVFLESVIKIKFDFHTIVKKLITVVSATSSSQPGTRALSSIARPLSEGQATPVKAAPVRLRDIHLLAIPAPGGPIPRVLPDAGSRPRSCEPAAVEMSALLRTMCHNAPDHFRYIPGGST
jgi:hypothetical protein